MKGFPKHLNSKFDYLYIKQKFSPEDWKPAWQSLLNESKNWFCTGVLQNYTDGVTDTLHKVVQSKDMDNKDIFMQYELQTDPSSDMIKMGFTEAEIQQALNE